jgi:hypothetical protein
VRLAPRLFAPFAGVSLCRLAATARGVCVEGAETSSVALSTPNGAAPACFNKLLGLAQIYLRVMDFEKPFRASQRREAVFFV